MSSVFDIGSPAAIFAAVAAGAVMKYAAGALLWKPQRYRLVGKVGEIWIFPIKSTRGIQITEADIGKCGLLWKGSGDRQWCVTKADGKFISMVNYPSMALVQPVICGDEMELQAPGMEPIRFPLRVKVTNSNLSQAIVFKSTAPSIDLGDKVGNWFSRYLKTEGLRLHYSEDSLEKRDASKKIKDWRNPAIEGDVAAFANSTPYLVLSEESVNFINTKLKNPVPTCTFRANIIIHDCDAYSEETWTSLQIGNAVLRALDCCTRCPLTTVNTTTGIKDPEGEPLATMKKFRLKEPYGKKAIMGVNFAPDKLGSIRVGDPVYATFA